MAGGVTRFLTTSEAADVLRCHEKTVRRHILRGDLPATFVAGRYLIDPKDLPTTLPEPRAPRPRRPGAARGRATAAARRVTGGAA